VGVFMQLGYPGLTHGMFNHVFGSPLNSINSPGQLKSGGAAVALVNHFIEKCNIAMHEKISSVMQKHQWQR
jgi:hypothetical protein